MFKMFDAAREFANFIGNRKFSTILADPPWQFKNRTGKMAPEHKRLNRYSTLSLKEICEIPIPIAADNPCHLYLWVPNALLPEGLEVMKAWGFLYKTNIIWHKVRKDGQPDGRGVGFYFRNTTEMILFGIRGHQRTLAPGRSQVNIIRSMKQEHSRKPEQIYDIIERCSSGPYLELFARGTRKKWTAWGNQANNYEITWATYANNSNGKKNHAASVPPIEQTDSMQLNLAVKERRSRFHLSRKLRVSHRSH
jgi:N6-adenosine-specific RNA methylase IME4